MTGRSLARRRAALLTRALAVVFTLAIAGAFPAGAAGPAEGPDWSMNGHDPANTRNQAFENDIGVGNVARLAPRWVATTAGDVSATPAVVGGAVYFPDWGGKLWSVDAQTGAVNWSHEIADYTGIAGAFSRTSPAVDGGLVYVGDQNGSHFMAVDARTGDLAWMTRLENHK